MNNKTLISIGVVVVLAVAGIFFFASNSSDEDSVNNLSQSGSADQNSQSTALTPDDYPSVANIFGQPFVSNIKTTDPSNPSSDGTIVMTFNNSSLWQVEVNTAEGSLTTIYTADASYVSSPEGWTKFPTGQGGDFDVTSYGFNDDDVTDFGESATKLGTEPCSLGTCTVWQSTDLMDGSTGKVWFGPDGRLARMMVEDGSSTTDVVYTYDNVPNIEVPTDFQEFTIPEFEDLDLDSLTP